MGISAVWALLALLLSDIGQRAGAVLRPMTPTVTNQFPTLAVSVLVLPVLLFPLAANAGCDLVDISSLTNEGSFIAAGFDKSVLIDGLISGAAINAAKNIFLHPIETVKARLDTGAKTGLFDDAYSGIVPAMAGGVPAAAVFFGAKDVCRLWLRQSLGLSPQAATILAVTIASFPYWLLRNPSEVLKTRVRTGTGSSNIFEVISKGGVADLYAGIGPNLLYSLPSDWLKFISYELISSTIFGIKEGGVVSGVAAMICGGLAALIAETICTPLDVVRTRIMCISKQPQGVVVASDKSSDESIPNVIIAKQQLSQVSASAGAAAATSIVDEEECGVTSSQTNNNNDNDDIFAPTLQERTRRESLQKKNKNAADNRYERSVFDVPELPSASIIEGDDVAEGTIVVFKKEDRTRKAVESVPLILGKEGEGEEEFKVIRPPVVKTAPQPTNTVAINPIKMVIDIIREDGLGAIFAGAVPRSARALLDGAVQFVAYETTQNFLHRL